MTQPDPTALIAAVREQGLTGELREQLQDAFEHGPAAEPIAEADQQRREGVGEYLLVYDPGHPLARADGTILEHRQVLYAKLGPDRHPCHWCGRTLQWKGPAGSLLTADHLNGIRDDNRPENLVAACHGCNRSRGGAEIRWSRNGQIYRRDRKPWN